jgi:2Fe-2S ferredoxin
MRNNIILIVEIWLVVNFYQFRDSSDFLSFLFPKETNIFTSKIKKMAVDITVTIIDREGVSHELKAPTDMSMNIMELCKSYDLPVKGECGGMAMCATCQCYLESDTELDPQGDSELDMLDQAFYVKPNSRLGCQIHITEEIDGIVLRLAPEAE